jgi:hypothetical protein
MNASLMSLRQLFVYEEDAVPPARRSRRDRYIDSLLFIVAISFGVASLRTAYQHRPHAALYFIDLKSFSSTTGSRSRCSPTMPARCDVGEDQPPDTASKLIISDPSGV